MFFKDVIGQQEVKQKLVQAAKNNRTPHAMLFWGGEGVGSLPLALALAQYIICENKQESDSCGQCPACLKAQKFIHPDVHFTFPTIPLKPGKVPVSTDYIVEWRKAISENPYLNANEWLAQINAENKQGNITVLECHEIIKSISLKTYEATHKVQIIWLAEYLREAGNVLLKIIEEPPTDTIFILIVENMDLMLNTILSRTQIVKIQPIEEEAIVAALTQNQELNQPKAEKIARIADGNYNAALNALNDTADSIEQQLKDWIELIVASKTNLSGNLSAKLIDWVEEIAKAGRENQKIFLKYFLYFLRESSLFSILKHSTKLQGEELRLAQMLTNNLTALQIEQLSQIVNNLHYHIERNANAKIVFMASTIKMSAVLKGTFANAEM